MKEEYKMQQRPALELTQEDIRYLEERLGEPEGLDKLELRLVEDWKKDGCSLEEIVRELQFL